MRRLFPLLFAGCGFSNPLGVAGDGSPGDTALDDAGTDADDIMPDARVCFGAGLGRTCLPAAPSAPLALATRTFDTGGAGCTHVVTVGGANACVLAGTVVTLDAGDTFRAIGARPLVIVASETLTITGTLDASSQRTGAAGPAASTAACAMPGAPEDDTGGGGGGAGGSFGGRGGNGGLGDDNQSNAGGDGRAAGGVASNAITLTALSAGCPGATGGDGNGPDPGGAGGRGGGGVYLIAGTSIQITGDVLAVGAGGGGGGRERAGGGGGGAGGLIGLDAPVIAVGPTAAIVANGGSGGEGGTQDTLGGAGMPGGDGTPSGVRTAGGDGGTTDGGRGGDGSGLLIVTGDPGAASDGGGGGGGGGAGHVYVKGSLTNAGTISPPASVTP